MAVPRVWEKFEEKMKDIARENGALKTAIAGWAKRLGEAKVNSEIKHEAAPFCYSFANFLILKRIKQALGLDMVKMFFFGAAPLK